MEQHRSSQSNPSDIHQQNLQTCSFEYVSYSPTQRGPVSSTWRERGIKASDKLTIATRGSCEESTSKLDSKCLSCIGIMTAGPREYIHTRGLGCSLPNI